MKIEEISKEFKDFIELQKFAEAQFKLITELSRKVNDLEEERNHLKKLLETGVTPEQLLTSVNETKQILKQSSDSEAICLMQLKLLRNVSLERELTLEEVRKCEIFSKLLLSFKPKDKNKDASKELSDEDLLAELQDDTTTTNG